MMMGDYNYGGSTEGPVSPDNYKRAVYRAPPPRFTVEMLPPTKHGGDFSYGMLVCPIKTDTASISSSRTNQQNYEIWRRWPDCLMFQETLEMEYRRMARSKKQRLVAGKGIKKNGVYIHDQAASFESLPNGPDPNSVHLNIHDYLPKLTKKGTLFRTSPATVEQRNKELCALIESLFNPDAPTLLIELREDRLVTDFFGFWRRDYDLARKLKRTNVNKSRSSVSGSVFSLYFSSNLGEDVPSTPSLPLSPSIHSRLGRSTSVSSHISKQTPPSLKSANDSLRRPSLRNAPNSTSSSSSDGGSSRDSKGSDQLGSIVITEEDTPIVFGYNPEHSDDRTAPEIFLPSSRRMNKPSVVELGKTDNRKGQVFTNPPVFSADNGPTQDDISVFESDRSDRASWMTAMSATEYFEQLGLPLSSPDTDCSFRDSVATFRTDCSADGVIGHRGSSHFGRSFSASPRHRTASICEEEEEEEPSYDSDRDDDLVNSHLYDALDSPQPSTTIRPETASSTSTRPRSIRLSNFFRPRASSFNSISTYASTSTSSTSTSVTGGRSINTVSTKDDSRSLAGTVTSTTTSVASEGTVPVKAAYEDSIVVLRVPKTVTLDEMRRRLHDKFVRQENVPLRTSFAIAQVIPTSPVRSVFAKQRPGAADVEVPRMCVIDNESAWGRVLKNVSTSAEKLNLRLLDYHL